MNDTFRELKARVRRLDDARASGAGSIELAQALSQARRVLRRADRSRAPSAELETLVQRAEALAQR